MIDLLQSVGLLVIAFSNACCAIALHRHLRVVCEAMVGPIAKLDGHTCRCNQNHGHALPHTCSCGSWFEPVKSTRR